MKIKTDKGSLICLFLIALLIFLGVTCLFTGREIKSSYAAEMQSECIVTFNYENFYKVTSEKGEYITQVRRGNNVTSGKVIDRISSESTVEIYLIDATLLDGEVLENGGILIDDNFSITVNSDFYLCDITIKNSLDEEVGKSNNNIIQLNNLEEDTFAVEISLKGETVSNNGVTYQYTLECSFSFNIEKEPVGNLIKSTQDNSFKFSWDNKNWEATLNGSEYINGSWISAEGDYEIRLYNRSGRYTVYNFTIDHFYIIANERQSTCSEIGFIQYKCLHCDDIYLTFMSEKEHKYIAENILADCVNYGGLLYTCEICGNRYFEPDGTYPIGHNYTITIVDEPTCTSDGLRRNTCDMCGDIFDTKIATNGHNFEVTDTTTENGKTTRIYTCTVCGHRYKQELGDQYEEVSNYMEYLFLQYEPYMWLVFLAAAGVWSIAIGVMIAIASKHEDKEKAKKMLVNYVIGLVVIAIVLVACPFLMRGFAALIT